MTYEICKQLKDAGFPQGIPDCYTFEGDWIPEEERRYVPTLSELIEACGNEFGSLSRWGGFRKFTPLSDEWVCWKVNGDGYDSCGGKTPEEAVVKLWLELNKI